MSKEVILIITAALTEMVVNLLKPSVTAVAERLKLEASALLPAVSAAVGVILFLALTLLSNGGDLSVIDFTCIPYGLGGGVASGYLHDGRDLLRYLRRGVPVEEIL